MELSFGFLLSSCFFLLFLSSFLLVFYKHNAAAAGPALPPGNMGLPFIGESLEFLSTGWKGSPEKFVHDRMAKFSSKIFKTSILLEPAAVFCGAAGNKFLFSNENKLVVAWWPRSVNKIFPSTLRSSSVEESRKMRKLLPGFLKPEALQRYVGTMDAAAVAHLRAHWEGKTEIAVFPLAKRYTFALACRLFLSMEDPGLVERFAEPFNEVASGIISVLVDFPGTPFHRGVRAAGVIRRELREIIRKRKEEMAAAGKGEVMNDILSHMVATAVDEEGQRMEETDVADKILGLLIGGHDTASAAITFVVKYLAELPHVYDKVFEEQMEIAKSKVEGEVLKWEDIQKMKYSWNVACEVMRLAPPLQGAFREAISDFSYAGFSIPKGWKLYWSAHTTHRNPECFPEPEKFDPSRYEGGGPAPYTYVPFGGGPRMCPGKEYARLEILVFMHNIVKRFKWEKLLPSENIIVDPMPIPAKGLPIRLHPHTKA